jgi:hypothetical protein
VRGAAGIDELRGKVLNHGVMILFTGSFGSWILSMVGYFPWYATFNVLNTRLRRERGWWKHARNGAIGLCASIAADTLTNSVRVVKVVAQTSVVPLGYVGAARQVIAEAGVIGLLFRGLPLKLISNGVQCILFTVVWRHLMEVFALVPTPRVTPGVLPTPSVSSDVIHRGRMCTTTVELLRWLLAYFVLLCFWLHSNQSTVAVGAPAVLL